ncbi:MAG: TIGR02281 family clan AA aspartic protease [Pseudomonadota bacterium]
MAPWVSLALLILAGLGLVLRHDMLPVLGFDLGLASAATAAAGLILFTAARTRTDDQSTDHSDGSHPGVDSVASSLARQALVVVTSIVALVGGLTLADVTTRPSPPSTVTDRSQLAAHGLPYPTHRGALPRSERAKKQTLGHRTGRVALVILRGQDQLFTAAVRLNRHPTRLAIDTGAARVVLTAEDARRSGVDLDRSIYTVPVETSAGTVYAAPVTVGRIDVGPLGVSNVPTLVAQPGKLARSLLGMSFLKRLGAYTVEGDSLTLESQPGIRLSRDRAVHKPDAAISERSRAKEQG